MKQKKKQFTRVNGQIRFSPVMVVHDGSNLGVLPVKAALNIARKKGLDLVEVSPDARPPVCRIMDYGKFKYEKSKKKQSKKEHEIKEVRLSPRIGEHDIETKLKAIRKFLAAKHQVRLKLQFKKRENAHKDLGFTVIKRIIEDVSDVGEPKHTPSLAGSQITCIIEPLKSK